MNKNSSQTFIFYGPSGSGKGTQAKLLIEYIKEKKNKPVLYVETGQRFRDFFDQGSYTSRLTKEVLESGGLLPPFLPIWTWTHFFIDHYTGEEDLVLDGLCRRPAEAPIVDSAMKFYGLEKPTVIVLNVSDASVMERLQSRGRSDDSDQYIKRRIEWYHQQVIPTIQFFRENPGYEVIDIDGEKSVEDVSKEILSKIELR